jgi:glycosyltransferase involved in cell wall biosynthesis
VTCHDLDTFRCLLEPDRDPRPRWFRALARRTLKGFQRAAHVICVSEATRTELQRRAWFREDQLSVIHSGVHPDLSPATDRSTDEWARQLVGEGSGDQAYLLHVGSTAQRKRIDLLLEVFASILPEFPNIRMVRVGERFTESQAALASRLGLDEKIVCVSGVQPDRLGALYRGAAVLLQTSDREGFGLPVIEALSCGCCVVASDIPPLREAGGNVATYCPVADISAWSETVKRHLRECSSSPSILDWRRTERKRHAAKFNWSGAASQTTDVYRQVLSAAISHRPPLKTDRPLSRRTCL